MTTFAVLERPTLPAPAPAPPPTPSRVAPLTSEARLAALTARRKALQSLDAEVRSLLRRCLVESSASSPLTPVIDLTIYDAMYAAFPSVGGHWTVALRRPTFTGLHMATYTVLAEFDTAHIPARFRVCGASETVTEDASMASLERALVQARAAGPQTTWAPAFATGISL